jgi:hypothetical protein
MIVDHLASPAVAGFSVSKIKGVRSVGLSRVRVRHPNRLVVSTVMLDIDVCVCARAQREQPMPRPLSLLPDHSDPPGVFCQLCQMVSFQPCRRLRVDRRRSRRMDNAGMIFGTWDLIHKSS